MNYENIQVGYNTETNLPIFEKREVKERTMAPVNHKSMHKPVMASFHDNYWADLTTIK